MPVPKLNDVFSFLVTIFFFLASFNFVIITFFSLSLCAASALFNASISPSTYLPRDIPLYSKF